MPFKSDAQRRLMYAVAEDPKLAKEKGIPQSVAHEFIAADKAEKAPLHKKMGATVDALAKDKKSKKKGG